MFLDLVRVAVVAPLGSSDHPALSIAISMVQAIPNLCVSRRVILKHRVNWTAVCDGIGVLPWRSIWSADNPVERLNYLSLLVERFVSTKVIRVHNKEKPWFNDECRLAFDIKQGADIRWTRDRSRVHWANAVYAEAMRQFSVRSRNVLMSAQCPHKWWSTLKSAQVRIRLFLLLLGRVVVWSVSRSGRQICCRPILMESSPGIQ